MNQPHIRILRRPLNRANAEFSDNAQPLIPTKTLEQREADYAAARRRIMGSESEDSSTVSESLEAFNIGMNTCDIETVNMKSYDEVIIDQKLTTQKPSQTAIPLMSIPTVALPIPVSLERSSLINSRISLPTKSFSQTHIPIQSLDTSAILNQRHFPAYCSNISSSHQLPNELSDSIFQNSTANLGYSHSSKMLGNFNSSLLQLQNNVASSHSADFITQLNPGNDVVDASKTSTYNMSAMLYQINLLRQYHQALATSRFPAQQVATVSRLPLSSNQNCYQSSTCNQMQNEIPSMHFQASPPRFTYSSGYN